MSPKKKKRPIAAQQLIDSLLLDDKSSSSDANSAESGFEHPPLPSSTDDNEDTLAIPLDAFTPTPSISSPSLNGPVYDENQSAPHFALEETSQKFGLDPIAQAAKTAASERKISPKRVADSAPPFEGTSPIVTKLSTREERLQQTGSLIAPEDLDAFQLEDNTLRIENKTKSKYGAEEAPPAPMELSAELSSAKAEKLSLDDDRTVPAQARSQSQSHSQSDSQSHLLKLAKTPPAVRTETPIFERNVATEIRTGVRTPPPPNQSTSLVFASSDAALKQSESLRIAQSRISELEAEMERLRRDNESLATAGDTLRRRMDELLGKAENLEIQSRENQKIYDEEKKVLRGQAQSKERENADLRARMEELELRLESNFKKIRVRERELEHRLEIVKMESATLVSSKDKMILDLKRQIDQLSNENDFAKIKTQELYNQHKDKQETIRRVVRALRIALTILEGDEDNVVPLKKAE